MNLVELIADDDEFMQAPCKYGNIVKGHACYCHSQSEKAPRKCPIWRNGEEWNLDNCELFEVVELVATPHKTARPNEQEAVSEVTLEKLITDYDGYKSALKVHNTDIEALKAQIAERDALIAKKDEALVEIASITQTTNLLWWQIKAREALKKGEL